MGARDGDRKYARRRPTQPPLTQYDLMLVLRRLHADDRYQRYLTAPEKLLLDKAVEERIGGHGWFWWKRENWAAAASVSTKTVGRALNKFCDLGLIVEREVFLRPPTGRPGGGQQSSPNLRLDPAMVFPTGEDTESVPAEGGEHVACTHATGGDTESPRTGEDTESPQNEIVERNDGGERVRAARSSFGRGRAANRGHGRRQGNAPEHAPEPEDFVRLLDALGGDGPTSRQRREFLAAYNENRQGFAQCAQAARRGDRPVALLTSRVRDGAHRAKPKQKPATCPECDVAEGKGHADYCSLRGAA